MKHCKRRSGGKPRKVEITTAEYADLLYCKHKLLFMAEINALRDTIKDLEATNARLLDEKYRGFPICEMLKGEAANESI